MFAKLKNEILGKGYSLSIADISSRQSQEFNKKYRKCDKPTNVLSFALSENSGELILCRNVIHREARVLGTTYEDWYGKLVIHGMLHLKGYDHGSIMKKLEEKYLSRLKFLGTRKKTPLVDSKNLVQDDQKYFNRHRPRLVQNQSRGRRVLKGRKKSENTRRG